MLPKHFDPAAYDAFLFDLDGVITPTVEVHRRAWQRTFDELFKAMKLPPYSEAEYFDSLDGRARFEGVATLLKARCIELPEEHSAEDQGTEGSAAEWQSSIQGIGNRKNQAFTEVLERDGIEAYPGSVRLLDQLRELGKPLAVVSSSRNAEPVLGAAKLRDRFLAVVDGVVAAREELPGKPDPETFLRAAELLEVSPQRCVVFEDAVSGVEAGRAGGFGLVVGVDRGAGEAALRLAGADLVVQDLEELTR